MPGDLEHDPQDERAGDATAAPHAPRAAAPRSLPVVGQAAPDPRPRRHPSWIRARLPSSPTYFQVRDLVHGLGLHTVCESASCPNVGECWSQRALTIMILGDVCTRSCRFCDVATGRPAPPDPDEPRRVGEVLARLGLAHAVITCVDRDDLADGGAAHWAATIREVKARCPEMMLEVLTGDFKGDTEAVDVVLAARPDVFAHNLETVPRLSREVRVQASYPRSYQILEHAHRRGAVTKTGLMLGLGETLDEVREVLHDVRRVGVDIVTLGQYLRPSRQHLEIARYVPPEEFRALGEEARALGFAHVESGPLVRSSYHADGQRDVVVRLAAERRGPGV